MTRFLDATLNLKYFESVKDSKVVHNQQTTRMAISEKGSEYPGKPGGGGRTLSGKTLPKLLRQFGGILRAGHSILTHHPSPWVDESGNPKPEIAAHFRRQLVAGVEIDDFVGCGGKISECALYLVVDNIFYQWAMYPGHILVVDPHPERHHHDGPFLVAVQGQPVVLPRHMVEVRRWQLEVSGHDDATVLGGIIGVIREPGPWPLRHPWIVRVYPSAPSNELGAEDPPPQ